MAIKEKYGSREYELSIDGGSGRRIFTCKPNEARQCVAMGAQFPGVTRLRAYRMNVRPLTPNTSSQVRAANEVEVTIDYAVKENVTNKPKFSIEGGAKVLETGLGRRWVSDASVCQQAQGIYYSTMLIAWTQTLSTVPLAAMANNLNRVNWNTFFGFPAETVLFEGFGLSDVYDPKEDTFKYEVTFRFHWQNCPWNVVWRAGEQAVVGGVPQYDSAGNEIWYSLGKWDRLYPALYLGGDFGPMMGLSPSSNRIASYVPPASGGPSYSGPSIASTGAPASLGSMADGGFGGSYIKLVSDKANF